MTQKQRTALDHLRHIWKGPDGGLAQPLRETWIDREAKILTVLIVHGYEPKNPQEVEAVRVALRLPKDAELTSTVRIRGHTLEYLCRKARISRSDWFRGMAVLIEQAKVVSTVPREKIRSKRTGEVCSLPNDYFLHCDRLLRWTGKPRPDSWPGAPPPAREDEQPGAYELAFEEARLALGLASDDTVEEQRLLAQRADRELRRLAATQERLNRELERLAKRKGDFERQTAARAATAIVALRQQAGLPARDLPLPLAAGDWVVAPASRLPARTIQDTDRRYTENLGPVEDGATPQPCGGLREDAASPRDAQAAGSGGLPESGRNTAASEPERGTDRRYTENLPRPPPSGPRADPVAQEGASTVPDAALLAFARSIASAKPFARNILARVEHGRDLTPNERTALTTMYAEAHPTCAPPARAAPEEPTPAPLWGPKTTMRLKIMRAPPPPPRGAPPPREGDP
jgi:hypothetical protein